MKRAFSRLVLAVLLLVGGLAWPAAVQAAPLAFVTPGNGPTDFVVQISGFAASERVSTWLTGPRQQVVPGNQHSTNERGERSFRVRIPRFYEPGRWAITVQGLSSDRQAIAFLYMPVLPPSLPVSIVPSRVAAGGSVRVDVAGLAPGEVVTYWLTAPDGRAVAGAVLSADLLGGLSFDYGVSVAAQSGLWTMSVYGERSDQLGIAFFAVVGSGSAQGPAGLRPEQAVASFYAWYLSFPGGALATGAYRESPFLTDALKAAIAAAVIAAPEVDPFVCGSQLPGGVRTDPPFIEVDVARVGVATDLASAFVVVLRLIDGVWLMDSILCS